MRRIPLRVVPDQRFPPGSPEYAMNMLDWRDAIRQVVRRPLNAQAGADLEELRRGIRVLDALEHASGDEVLLLEDADYDHLKMKTVAMQWAFVDRRVLAFVDDVLGATEGELLPSLNGQLAHVE